MSWVLHDKTLQETIAYPDKRKSLLVIQIQETLGNKLNGLKPLYSRKKSFAFQKLRKMFWRRRTNLADQNKQQPREINMRVTYHT